MKIRHPMLLGALIGCAIGIILAYAIVQYTATQSCPKQTNNFISLKQTCPECPKCFNTTCINESLITPATNREYPEMLGEEIRNANTSLHIIAADIRYYTRPRNATTNTLIDEIINADKRGVEVKILLDQNSGDNQAAYDYLIENNVSARYDPDNVTTNAKIILIDGETTILGTSDLAQNSLQKNNEANIRIKSRAVTREYETYFQTLWNTNQ